MSSTNRQKNEWLPRILVFTSLLLGASAVEATELMVHPKRVVFEGNQRTAQMDVINSGTEPTTYRISIVRRRMTEMGDFADVDTPLEGELFADDLVRYSPRQVTLQPGVAQAVRMQLRKPAGLPDGEYRSHLLFEVLPGASEPQQQSDQQSEPNTFNIELRAIYSISVPIIVRHGNLSAATSITDLSVDPSAETGTPPAVTMVLHRTGNRSVYGDLTVYLQPLNGAEKVIGRANGVAIYTPNTRRYVRLPLQGLSSSVFPHGTLRVTFTERPEEGGALLAESEIQIR